MGAVEPDGVDPVGSGPAPDPASREGPWGRVAATLFRIGLTPVQLVAAVVVLGAGGVIAWAVLTPPVVPLDVRIPAVTVPPPSSTVPPPLSVHAAGAVAAPGLYQLPAGSRVADLLDAAGGPVPDADLDRVNLAASLEDGWQVQVPRVGESTSPVVTPGGTHGGGVGTGTGIAAAGPGEPVDLNTATAEELESLPGIGPSLAAAVVEHRERSGGFRSVEDLLDVPGIGPARFENLRDLVVAG